jgi:myosin-7
MNSIFNIPTHLNIMQTSLQIPGWIKEGLPIWYEVRGRKKVEVDEYLPGIILQLQEDSFSAKISISPSSSEKIVKLNEIHLRTLNPQIVENLTDIPSLNDAELLHHLFLRYQKKLIYCYCGLSLIAINPYENIPHETSKTTFQIIADAYQNGTIKEARPHIWSVAALALHQASISGESQAICINGESGSGKTVATKLCLQFVSDLQKQIMQQFTRRNTLYSRKTILRNSILKETIDENEIEITKDDSGGDISERILACNPLLEAFGNAKTSRNDNSSRFGKYIKLFMDKDQDMKILGAVMENYLLEKTRVVKIDSQERTFHIFYAMCRFMEREKLMEYGLLQERQFNDVLRDKFSIFGQSDIYETSKIDDEEFYSDVVNSFQTLNFSEDMIDSIWRIVGAILFLQNVTVDSSAYIEGQKPCSILKDENWQKVINLLGVNEQSLEEGLTIRKIVVNNKEMRSVFAPSDVEDFVLILAKELYNNMFNWLFKKLNQELEGDIKKVSSSKQVSMGVLDIFGFEIFDNNSLEQLFINYANERLQGLYVEDTFKNECVLFENEGLGKYTDMITYSDNLPLIHSLDRAKGIPIGIFPLTDQYSKLKRTDNVLMDSLKGQFKSSEHVTFHKFKKEIFYVKHTARQVEYTITNFINKNQDEVSDGLITAIRSSKYLKICQIFNQGMSSRTVKIPSSKSINKSNQPEKFLAKKFVSNMDQLMTELKSGQCHFVRCIKPNEFKRANNWVNVLALRQIRYMGLLDSLKVRKNNYPNRFTFKEFYLKYQEIDTGKESGYTISELNNRIVDFSGLVKQVLDNCDRKPEEKDLLIGRTKVLINEEYFNYLGNQIKQKQILKTKNLKTISLFFKGQIIRKNITKFFIEKSNGLSLARDVLSSMQAKVEFKKFKKFLNLTYKMQNAFRIRKHYRIMSLRLYKTGFIMKVTKIIS